MTTTGRHGDGLWDPFEVGLSRPFASAVLETFLAEPGIELVAPGQFMDQRRLDASGIRRSPTRR